MDAAAARFVDDDLSVDVQVFRTLRTDEQGLVDRVLLLHRVDGNPLEPHLLVQLYGFGVVVQHRQVHERAAGFAEVSRQRGDQADADRGHGRLTVDGERPQGGALFRIVEGRGVIDAHDDAENLAILRRLRDQDRDAMPAAELRQKSGLERDHAARRIDAVDHAFVGRLGRADREHVALGAAGRHRQFLQVEAETVGRIHEQGLRRHGQDHVRVAHIDGEVALTGFFLHQPGGEKLRLVEGLAEQHAAPAAMHGDAFADRADAVLGRRTPMLQGQRVFHDRVFLSPVHDVRPRGSAARFP